MQPTAPRFVAFASYVPSPGAMEPSRPADEAKRYIERALFNNPSRPSLLHPLHPVATRRKERYGYCEKCSTVKVCCAPVSCCSYGSNVQQPALSLCTHRLFDLLMTTAAAKREIQRLAQLSAQVQDVTLQSCCGPSTAFEFNSTPVQVAAT